MKIQNMDNSVTLITVYGSDRDTWTAYRASDAHRVVVETRISGFTTLSVDGVEVLRGTPTMTGDRLATHYARGMESGQKFIPVQGGAKCYSADQVRQMGI